MHDTCGTCGTESIISVMGKCSDMTETTFNDKSVEGYIPDLGIGSSDYIQFEFCHICLRLQIPEITPEKLREVFTSEDEEE